jgi:hypothetical protein
VTPPGGALLSRGVARAIRSTKALILADEGRIDLDQLPDDVRESGAPRLSLPEAVERIERSHIALVLHPCDDGLDLRPAWRARRLGAGGGGDLALETALAGRPRVELPAELC